MAEHNGNSPNGANSKSWMEQLGCDISAWVADIAGHPFAQVGFVVLCLVWFVAGWNVSILTAGLSILAITLTQMVLNSQKEREIDAHRRDVGMHAKLDELIAATRMARNDFVAVEEREEDEIVQLKDEVKEQIEEEPGAADPAVRETAKRAVETATDDLKKRSRNKQRGASAAKKKR